MIIKAICKFLLSIIFCVIGLLIALSFTGTMLVVTQGEETQKEIEKTLRIVNDSLEYSVKIAFYPTKIF